MSESKNVLVYTDIGDDIDDALALCHLIEHTSHTIVGIIVSYGDLLHRTTEAKKVCDLYGVNIPILAGSSKLLDSYSVWFPGSYQEQLHELTAPHSSLSILSLAPCTDVAKTLMYSDFTLIEKLKELIFQGDTTEKPWQADTVNSYNFKCDPRAARIATDTGLNNIFVSKDEAYKNPLRKDDFLNFSKYKGVNEFLLSNAVEWQTRFKYLNHEKYQEIYGADPTILSFPYDLMAAKKL